MTMPREPRDPMAAFCLWDPMGALGSQGPAISFVSFRLFLLVCDGCLMVLEGLGGSRGIQKTIRIHTNRFWADLTLQDTGKSNFLNF